MSAQEGHPSHASSTHHDARVHRLERVLHAYGGTLTRSSLYELSGASCWDSRDTFDAVLSEAVRNGRIAELGGVLLRARDD
jgi:hypothetical protein